MTIFVGRLSPYGLTAVISGTSRFPLYSTSLGHLQGSFSTRVKPPAGKWKITVDTPTPGVIVQVYVTGGALRKQGDQTATFIHDFDGDAEFWTGLTGAYTDGTIVHTALEKLPKP